MSSVLLLSGGIDSACVAAMERPEHCLFIDYGQAAATTERQAAGQVAEELHLPFDDLSVRVPSLGSGLMSGETRELDRHPRPAAAPEWWPFRNQLLITLAASWAVTRGHQRILIGTVATDSARHRDGSAEFLARIDGLTRMQEGGVEVAAPAAAFDTATLIARSGITDQVLAWTHSCHRSNLPCANCPGCTKRAEALEAAARLQ